MAKVLISAFACQPNAGSETGIGWNFVVHTARTNDVWVLTRPDNRPFIEPYVANDRTGVLGRIKFVYVPWSKWADKLVPDRLLHVRYSMWQSAAAKAAIRLHDEVGFDLVQHVTYGCYWQPAGVSVLDVPMIWGPVGGGESAPPGLLPDLGRKGRMLERARDLARWMGENSSAVRRTAARATIALATTTETQDRLERLGVKQIELFTSMGLTAAELNVLARVPTVANRGNGGPLHVVSVGRLHDWKGFHLGLRAFAAAKLPPGSRYDIIGGGPAMARLKHEAQSLGIADVVNFVGHQPREQAMELLGKAHVLAHPSLHDSGGWVVLEAMAMGKPVVCLDLHGPTLMVTHDTGIKVPAETSQQVVTDLAEAFRRLNHEPDLLVQMGNAGRQRASEVFSWETRQRELSMLYARVTERSQAPVVAGANSAKIGVTKSNASARHPGPVRLG